MALLETVTVQCPGCWETIEIVVDCSPGDQVYVEDCEVCCRPMLVNVTLIDGLPQVSVSGDL